MEPHPLTAIRDLADAIANAKPPLPTSYQAAAWYIHAHNQTGYAPTNTQIATAAGLKGGKRTGIRVRHELTRRLPQTGVTFGKEK